MSSEWQDSYGMNRRGGHVIQHMGRYVYNVAKADAELKIRRANHTKKRTYYHSGGSEKELFTIQDREVTFMRKRLLSTVDAATRARHGTMEVLSSLNWAGMFTKVQIWLFVLHRQIQ